MKKPQQEQLKGTTVTERLLFYVTKVKHQSRNSFYVQTGVSNGTLDRKSGITTDSILKILDIYPMLNISWLITGEGEPESTNSSKNEVAINDNALKDKLIDTLFRLEEAKNEIEKWKETVRLRTIENKHLEKTISDLEAQLHAKRIA